MAPAFIPFCIHRISGIEVMPRSMIVYERKCSD
jgi:hypothetical protein